MGAMFRKRLISRENFEAASVFDVNNDGVMDIVSGGYWYEGPDFTNKHKIAEIPTYGEYRGDFCDYPMDVNGDGFLDIITASWFDDGLYWRENPGDTRKEWKLHKVAVCSPVETVRCFDIDGCGVPEVFPNTPMSAQCFFKLVTDEHGKGTGRFTKHVIGNEPSGHGMGFADINGDGRMDIVLSNGWLEQPDNLFLDEWTYHKEFQFGSASVPILGLDIAGNGMTDLIVGQGHHYGLHWYEQRKKPDGGRYWIRRAIEEERSQYHDLWLMDIDNDGELELITGTRWRAHNGNDPGEDQPIGLFYFKGVKGGTFTKHTIDFGDPGEASGVGIYFWVADTNNDGYLDIVAPGKEGLYLFENLGAQAK